jgi:hypothetical protein
MKLIRSSLEANKKFARSSSLLEVFVALKRCLLEVQKIFEMGLKEGHSKFRNQQTRAQYY